MNVDSLLVNFASHHPGDVADRMDNHPAEEVAALLQTLPDETACAVASRLASRPLSAVLHTLCQRKLGAMLVAGHYADVTSLVSHMASDLQQQVLAEALEHDKEQLSRLFHNSLKTLSGIASPDFVRVELSNRCRVVLEQLINNDVTEEQPIFVINEFGEYQGIVSSMVLLQEKNTDRTIADVLQHVEALSGITPFAAALAAPQWTRFRALPVIDNQSRLLGALSFEQLVRAHNGLIDEHFGLGELIGEVATGYIDVCASLMEITVGRNRVEPD
ncbi:magnesium transporter MgtE N-terminal domain-containing protein [Dasania marina]|uniref:magnesium transporter MgtE N-terminal domain-containing protein n=1 Tax=Dasania marina TaxID=471499 RepID=UPI00037D6834|nr:hypothetical protein [Dasania marina]